MVSTKADNDANIIIEAPNSTVTLEATKINSVVSTTSENTLIIPQGLELKNLTVKKGAVEYHGTGLTKVTVNPLQGANVYFKTSEGLANTDAVYGVVKDHVAEGFAITKETGTTWKIVPEVCRIGETSYASLSDAVSAAPESSETTIKMVNDVDYGDIAGDGAVVIPSGKVIILDLNGKKISASRTVKTNTSIIANDGKLTIIDNAGTGEIYMNSTVDDSGWSSSVSAITNRATLIVNSGHIHTDGAAGMSYAIDSRQNGYSFDVVATINGGLIEAPNYRAIRLFANGTNGADNLVVTGGEIVGKTAGIWQQDVNAYRNISKVTISGGKITATDESRHALYIDGNTDTGGLSATITGGQFKSPASSVFVENCSNILKFISGGIFSNKPDEALVAEGYIAVENTDEAYPWTVEAQGQAKIGDVVYPTLEKAVEAAVDANSGTIELLPAYIESGRYPQAWITSPCGIDAPEDLDKTFTFHAFNPGNGDEEIYKKCTVDMSTQKINTDDLDANEKARVDAILEECYDYLNWPCDYEVYFDNAENAQVSIQGNYAVFGWTSCNINQALEGNHQRLLLTMLGDSLAAQFNYTAMLGFVNQFHCGLSNDEPAKNAGKTFSVELYMYHPEKENVKILISRTDYTFPQVN